MSFIAKSALLAALALAGTGVSAATVFSETFSNPAFNGGVFLPNNTSDRFGVTSYAFANNANGWTFAGGGHFMAYSVPGGDGALLLNEGNDAATATNVISGLTVGQTYTLSFLLSGDNIPANPYRLTGSIANVSFTIDGIDGASGTNPGLTYTYNFTASSASHVLTFGQIGLSGASPMIDNILITGGSAIPEASTWAMLLTGFGLVGVAARRKRRVIAA